MNIPLGEGAIVVGAPRSERAVAIETVRAFMDAMARHDAAAAGGFLAPDFQLTAPGGHVFRALGDFFAFGATRYRSIGKQLDDIEATEAPTGIAVYARGTMSGAWLDGSPFRLVRFVDRMVLRDGRITEMQVWNDIGELRPR